MNISSPAVLGGSARGGGRELASAWDAEEEDRVETMPGVRGEAAARGGVARAAAARGERGDMDEEVLAVEVDVASRAGVVGRDFCFFIFLILVLARLGLEVAEPGSDMAAEATRFIGITGLRVAVEDTEAAAAAAFFSLIKAS